MGRPRCGWHGSSPAVTAPIKFAVAAVVTDISDRLQRIERDIADIKGRLNLLIAVVIPLQVVIIVRLFGIA